MNFKLDRWAEIIDSSTWSARTYHKMCVGNGYMYLTGGFVSGITASSDVYRSSDGVSWTLLTSTPGWSARGAHGCLFYNNKIYIFGGSDGTTFYNDCWSSSDGTSWTLETAAPGWAVRHELAYCIHNSEMYMSGGWNPSGGGLGTYFADIWKTTNGSSWSLVTANFGQALRMHEMVSFLGDMWIYGGNYNSSNYYNTIRQSTDDGVNWSVVGTIWAPRAQLKAFVNDTADQLVLLEGRTGTGVMNGAYTSPDGLNFTFVTEIESRPNRRETDFAYYNKNVHMFGGRGGAFYYNDVWKGKFVVYYSGNGAPSSAPSDPNFYDPESIVTVLSPGSMTWFGHTFINWNTKGDGSGTSYDPSDTFTFPFPDYAEVLYAQWDTIPMTFYVEAVGSNEFPFDTREKAANNFHELYQGLQSEGVYQMYEGWTALAFGEINEPADEWDYFVGDGAVIIGEDPQTTIVDMDTSYFDTMFLYNITFFTDNPNAEWNSCCYDPFDVENCKFNGNDLWYNALDYYRSDEDVRVIGCSFENFTYYPIYIEQDDLTAANEVIVVNNSFDNPTAVVELYIELYSCTIGKVHIYNNVAKRTLFFMDLDSVTINEFLHDHNISLEGYDYTEDGVPFLPDATETIEDPLYLYTDPNNMLEIDETSPAFSSGITRSDTPTTDLKGITFSDPPSIGAYEVFIPVIIADFEGTPRKGTRFLTVQFLDLSVGVGINSWLWDFGDGGTSTEQNPIHFYSQPGSYTVSLSIDNGSTQDTEIKIQYIIVNSKYTYDIAPDPDMKAYLYGTGSANKLNIGIKVNAMNLLVNN